MATFLQIAGVVAVVAGVALWSVPAALIVAGVSSGVVGLLLEDVS